jgi:hypothetical protein
VICI